MAGFAAWRAGRHRGLFWSAVVVALVALIGGTTVAYLSYQATAGPDGAVKGYFAALQRGDASAALGFGVIQAGDHGLLTGAVLREQQRVAPIQDVRVASVARSSGQAIVTVHYRLAFAGGRQDVTDAVPVVQRKGAWRLGTTAVLTSLRLQGATDRATIDGGPIPAGPVLLFPGAIPITFDTPLLELAPYSSSVSLSQPVSGAVDVRVTPSGRELVMAALARKLAPCLTGAPAAADCPLPAPRAVPASLRGRLVGPVEAGTTISVVAGAAGLIDVSGHVKVAGSFQVLDFNNIPHTRSATLFLPLLAQAFARAPISLAWQDGPV